MPARAIAATGAGAAARDFWIEAGAVANGYVEFGVEAVEQVTEVDRNGGVSAAVGQDRGDAGPLDAR